MPETQPSATPTIIVLDGRYHLGNNPGVFQGTAYVGLSLNLPVYVTWYDDKATEVAFVIETQDIESWGGTGGHRVLLNDVEIGRLADPVDILGRVERFRIGLATSKFEQIVAGKKNARLTIALEVSTSTPSLADDFVLRRIDTEQTLAVRLGAGA